MFGQLQTDYYVARGAGREVWSPRFTYKGFQYVQMSGPGGAALPAGVSVSLERVEQVRTSLVRSSRDDQPFVQTAQILPLAFGLVPDGQRGALAASLAADIAGRGGNAYVGVLGARYVLPVLTESGMHDAAVAVATQTDEPSWGYWTDRAGFSALGEHWPADTRSRNHHMFGSIVPWFYEDLAGIRALEPGYRLIEIRPRIPAAGLDHVEAWHDSVRGRIASRWRRTPQGVELDVAVPPNARARVYVPGDSPDALAEVAAGRAVPVRSAEGVERVGVADGHVVLDVGSGRYQFRRRD